jgi:hypothetical protein
LNAKHLEPKHFRRHRSFIAAIGTLGTIVKNRSKRRKKRVSKWKKCGARRPLRFKLFLAGFNPQSAQKHVHRLTLLLAGPGATPEV